MRARLQLGWVTEEDIAAQKEAEAAAEEGAEAEAEA